MTIVRRLARPLLSASFVVGGLNQFRHPGTKVAAARPLVEKYHEPLHLPNDPEMLVRANGAAMAGAGTLLALGRFPRLSSLVLTATLVPTTYGGHRFWEENDPQKRSAERVQFLKNLGLAGGLLIAAVDTQGKPGLGWRSRRAGRDAKRAAKLAAVAARRDARTATREVRREAKLAKARVGARSLL